MRAVLLTALIATVGLTACGENTRSCQNACQRAYRSEQCGLQIPGQSQSDLIGDCETECNNALQATGEIDGYDPDCRDCFNRSEPFELKNEKQAALWMDCVMDTVCEDLNDGYCPGGGIN